MRFIALIHKFQHVERRVFAKGKDIRENDVEHSYQLTVVSWFIASCNNLSLDKDLLIKYGLVHDLVEVYAGDTFFYANEAELKDKVVRE